MTADTLSLTDKVAIVTGSGKENGIGAGIATALARNGAWVVINHVSEATAPRAAEVCKRIEDAGGKAAVVRADVTDPKGARSLVEGALKAFGVHKVDILVNNAGGGATVSALKASKEDIEQTFAINVFAALYMTQAVVPVMPRGGRIINISSIASKMAMGPIALYSASKAASDTLAYAMAMELGRGHGITVNTIAPGPVPTDGLKNSPAADAIHNFLVPLTRAEERTGTVDDIADAALLLASERSRWITGQYISVSGGITGG